MRPIEIHYLGGPYDGAKEVLDRKAMGLKHQQGFRLAHLTAQFLHVYECEFWSKRPGKMPRVEVRHLEVRKRPAVVS